ncbi:hypothetical protein Hypma_007605 [Hypsizygus marmoreus]|uniref:F-box domain-containing protein n=1 Tax=Hypsizygus marmoreus TaxID=39966 RepID=A0A369K141_HYPMA|nr:hypothetical protein Hypma_007605 [Hypsizygus marmoreus]
MSTITLTAPQRVAYRRFRSGTLSLIVSHPPFLNLPIELSLSIFELAILDSKPSILAVICKSICRVLDIILYRTVVLGCAKTVQLFHRTTLSKDRAFLSEHVKKLVVTWLTDRPDRQLHDIVAACSGLRTLIIPSNRLPVRLAAIEPWAGKDGLSALTVRSFDDGDIYSPRSPQPVVDLSTALTHLRFCEPSDMWQSPSSMLESYGALPHLSHLQFARRTNANEDNDMAFAEDVRNILRTRPALKMVVVSIYLACIGSAAETVEDSDIWKIMCRVREEDARVIVVPGQFGEWVKGLEDVKALRSGHNPVDFWMSMKRAAKCLQDVKKNGEMNIDPVMSS